MSYDQSTADLLRDNEALKAELAELRAALIAAEPKADDTVYTEPNYSRVSNVEIVRALAAARDSARHNWGTCHERHRVAEGHNEVLRHRVRDAVLIPPDAVDQVDSLVQNAYQNAVDVRGTITAMFDSWRLRDPDVLVPECAVTATVQPPPRGVMHKGTMLPDCADESRRLYQACPADRSWTYLEAVSDAPMGNAYHRTRTETYILVWGQGLYIWSDVDIPNAPIYARQIVPGDFITIPPRRAYAFRLDPGAEMVCHRDGPPGDADVIEHVLYPPPPGMRQHTWAQGNGVTFEYELETDPGAPPVNA